MDYTTISGDTYDIIAQRALGNQLLANKIIRANPTHADVLIFAHNVTLTIPEEVMFEAIADDGLPPWKREDAE